MQKENLCPALRDTPTAQMSSKEFQQMLYSWFEEKGLVADLRSHLRALMVKKLRNTAVGRAEPPRAPFSLKKQAFSLVIAEHLLREGCHYTLSIFSTEEPNVASQLPFSLFEAHCQDESWRFDQDSALNVLELIGISKNSSESMKILSLYFRNVGSLLSCVISSKAANVLQDVQIQEPPDENIDDYLKRVLTAFGVPSTITDEMKRRIHVYVSMEQGRSSGQLQEHIHKVTEEFQTQLAEKDMKIQELCNEQLVYKRDIKQLKSALKDARKRLNQMILQEETLKAKTEQVNQKLDELSKLQEHLKHSFQKQKEKVMEVCQEKHCTEVCKSNTHLRDEMDKLKEIDKEKTMEAERLSSKLSLLMQDFKGSQAKIEILNSRLLSSNQIFQTSDQYESGDESTDTFTGEVIRQARSRLQQLERESDELDARCSQLILK